MQGRVMVSQPSVPAPLTLEIPFPPWATAIGEATDPRSEADAVAMFR
jgi:hypothetical protein